LKDVLFNMKHNYHGLTRKCNQWFENHELEVLPLVAYSQDHARRLAFLLGEGVVQGRTKMDTVDEEIMFQEMHLNAKAGRINSGHYSIVEANKSMQLRRKWPKMQKLRLDMMLPNWPVHGARYRAKGYNWFLVQRVGMYKKLYIKGLKRAMRRQLQLWSRPIKKARAAV
jgi:hypothetical protein